MKINSSLPLNSHYRANSTTSFKARIYITPDMARTATSKKNLRTFNEVLQIMQRNGHELLQCLIQPYSIRNLKNGKITHGYKFDMALPCYDTLGIAFQTKHWQISVSEDPWVLLDLYKKACDKYFKKLMFDTSYKFRSLRKDLEVFRQSFEDFEKKRSRVQPFYDQQFAVLNERAIDILSKRNARTESIMVSQDGLTPQALLAHVINSYCGKQLLHSTVETEEGRIYLN